jgi:RNA polymerase sigma factor (sigma-70 family)
MGKSLPQMAQSSQKAAAVEETIEKFSYLIRAAIRKTCPRIEKSDLDDIEQEVKIAIWKEIRKSEKEIRNLGSYIWRVAYTTTSKVMKRLTEHRKELVDVNEDGQPEEETFRTADASGPDYRYQNEELLRIVRKTVDLLIDSRRQVVKLYLTGMSADEISEYFGWSDGKARNLLSRGLADLRLKLLEKGLELEG